MTYTDVSFKSNITKKKLARGLGDPSDGLHDPPLERINGNVIVKKIMKLWRLDNLYGSRPQSQSQLYHERTTNNMTNNIRLLNCDKRRNETHQWHFESS